MKKKKLIYYRVDISFYSFEKSVKAMSAKEAREKVIASLQRRGLKSLVMKAYVDKDDARNNY